MNNLNKSIVFIILLVILAVVVYLNHNSFIRSSNFFDNLGREKHLTRPRIVNLPQSDVISANQTTKKNKEINIDNYYYNNYKTIKIAVTAITSVLLFYIKRLTKGFNFSYVVLISILTMIMTFLYNPRTQNINQPGYQYSILCYEPKDFLIYLILLTPIYTFLFWSIYKILSHKHEKEAPTITIAIIAIINAYLIYNIPN